MVKKLIIALASLFAYSGFGDMLYWQVDPNASVHHQNGTVDSLYSFLVPEPWRNEDRQPTNFETNPDGSPRLDKDGNIIVTGYGNGIQDASVGARINVYSADGTWLRTLENIHGTAIDDSWHSPIDIGHPNSPNGVGGTGVSTSLNGVSTDLDEYYQVAILSRSETEWNGNPVLREIAWTALYSGELLQANGHYSLDAESIEQLVSAWVPQEFYTYKPVPVYNYGDVPEPGSGLLTLVGLGILALRRKKTLE